MTQILRNHFTEFRQVFSKKTPESRGASFLLANTFATNIATALTSGVFYTAFMALNGIDIVRIGVLGSIPSFCYLVSLLTPKSWSVFVPAAGFCLQRIWYGSSAPYWVLP